MKHFLHAHRLCAQLDAVFFFLPHRPVFIFDRIQPYREIYRWNIAAGSIPVRLNTITLSQQKQAIREYRKFIKIYPFSAFLYSLSMYPRVLCAAFCSVRIFYPQSFIQEQPRAPGAICHL